MSAWRPTFSNFKSSLYFRWGKIVGCSLLLAELSYVLVVNSILASGAVGRLINDTGSAHVEMGSSYSLYPTVVHVTDLRVSYEDHNVQFAIQIGEARVSLRGLWLLKKRLSASQVRATDVRFFFRHKLDQVEGNAELLSHYPRIANVAEPPLLAAPKPSNPDDLWSFELNDVDVAIRELWAMTLRYQGEARAIGSFQLIPHQNLDVGPALLSLYSGTLHNGAAELITEDLHGEIALRLDPVNPDDLTGMAVFAPISAELLVSTELRDLNFLNAYLPTKLRIAAGAGAFELAATVDGGKLEPGSELSFDSSEPLFVQASEQVAIGDVSLKLAVARERNASVSGRANRVELRRKGSTKQLALLEGFSGGAEFVSLDISAAANEPTYTRVRVPALSVADLWQLDALFPSARPWALIGGSAKLNAGFESWQDGRQRAELSATLSRAELRANEHALLADATLALQYTKTASGVSELVDSNISLSHLMLRSGAARSSNSWATLSTEKLVFAGPATQELGGTVVLRAKSAEPVLNALEIPKIVRLLVPDEQLDVTAQLWKKGEFARLKLLRAETGNLEVDGELRQEAAQQRGVFRISGVAVPLGIELEGKDTEITLFASASWLAQRLALLAQNSKT